MWLKCLSAIDTGEALQLSNFVMANEEALEAGTPSIVEQYVDLILDVVSHPAPPLLPNALIASALLVPIVSQMVQLVASGGAPDIFDSLPI